MNLPLPIVYTDALERNIRLSDHTELPEIVLDIWGSRGDLKAVFPDPKTVYLERKNSDFKSWIFTQGFNEYLGLGHFYQFYVLRTDCLFRDLEIKNNQSVAIVLPTRDRLVSLGKSLDAVAKQSYSNWHLYLIDGSKNSDARQLAYEILGNNKVTYLKENLEPQIDLEQRVSSARNLGMRSSKEDLIAHLDDDNVWTPDHLSKLVAAMDADPLLAMAFSLHKVLQTYSHSH